MHTDLAVPIGKMEGQSLTTDFQEMLDAVEEERKRKVKITLRIGPQILSEKCDTKLQDEKLSERDMRQIKTTNK